MLAPGSFSTDLVHSRPIFMYRKGSVPSQYKCRPIVGMKEISEIRLENARRLAEQAGGTTQFAARVDREPTQMSRVMGSNPTKNIGSRLARHFEKCFGKPVGWMDKDHGSALQEIDSNVSGPPLPLREGRVPVIGTAQLGTDGYFDPMEYPVGHGDGYLLIYSDDEDAYGLKVVGNSMMPRIRHGEYVVIEPNHEFTAGDEVLVRTTDGQAMIKEFISCRDGQYRFQSINNDFEPIFIDEEQVECVQFMSAIVKASRYVP